MNHPLTTSVILELLKAGVSECSLCPAGRNAPFVAILADTEVIKPYYWFEERSAAFFALGRAQETKKPVAVITTSGTAAGELLPAIMEAHYTGTPLIAITADRPRRFRGTGAPQTAEQKGIFGVYPSITLDLAEKEIPDLSQWDQNSPIHINICFEEPLLSDHVSASFEIKEKYEQYVNDFGFERKKLDLFLKNAQNLLVIVSSLPEKAASPVACFLQELNAPVYLEAPSGLREHVDLQHISIRCVEHLSKWAKACDYPIQSVLRIGGVPTLRFWRDLEDSNGSIQVFSINQVPFSGLSFGSISAVDLAAFFKSYQAPKFPFPQEWYHFDRWMSRQITLLFDQFPCAEPSLIHAFSNQLNQGAFVYLGNSLPIREWDLAASYENKQFQVSASRGLNGIDGQISTFLGRCKKHLPNFAIIGDLTALYDVAAPWILDQLEVSEIALIVINNGGGNIFSRIFPYQEFQNRHSLGFEGMAHLWNLKYEKWTTIQSMDHLSARRLIELKPDPLETEKFWNNYQQICQILPSAVCTDS